MNKTCWYSFKDNPPIPGEVIELNFSNGYRETNPFNNKVDYSGSKVFPTFWRKVKEEVCYKL